LIPNDYFKLLEQNIDLKGLSGSGIEIFFDAIFGTGRGYLDDICKKYEFNIKVLNDKIDPYFKDKGPEPSSENLTKLKDLVKGSNGISVGVSTDGDADRFGIIGSDGEFIEPNKIIALLADYLYNFRNFPKDIGVSRSFATSSLLDMVAKKYDLKIYENPVGFKYIGKQISEDKIILGGEESAGLSIYRHVPEKDGILACLLVIEAMARKKATTNELLEDFYKRVGRLETKRENHRVSEEVKRSLPKKLMALKEKFLGKKVKKVEKIDGIKVYFNDGSWVLFRESGTEPLIRIYGEAQKNDDLIEIMALASKFLLEN